MAVPCVIYARVSTKEQADESYSIDAQFKQMREFCLRHGLMVREEFVEADSAAKQGRREFGRMVAYFNANPGVRTVVVHKFDRLARNWPDAIALDALGVLVRAVIGDAPDTPEGKFFADMQMSYGCVLLEEPIEVCQGRYA